MIVKDTTIAKYIGLKYSNLTVISFLKKEKGRYYFTCMCDCGINTVTGIDRLKSGKTKSCGCLIVKSNKARLGSKWSANDSRNRQDNPRLKRIWYGMLQRCNNPNSTSYNRYGFRGISVCKEWGEYEEFKKWALQNGYSKNLSIERKDNNGNYNPWNCKWATCLEQSRNTRRNVYFEYNGEKLTSKDWSLRLGFSGDLIGERIRRGWSVDKSIKTPPLSHGYTLKNEIYR